MRRYASRLDHLEQRLGPTAAPRPVLVCVAEDGQTILDVLMSDGTSAVPVPGTVLADLDLPENAQILVGIDPEVVLGRRSETGPP